MSSAAAVYIESHKRLSDWNDELEFLGFVLLEIVDPEGIEERGFCWHQAVDLPTIIDMLQHACSIPNEKLRQTLNKKSLKYFKTLLDQCRQIRNAMAHHQSPDESRLRILQEKKENLSSWLQSIIRLVASEFDIHEVKWCPYTAQSQIQATYNESTISLDDGPLLLQREQILESVKKPQIKSTSAKRKSKATEEGRKRHWEAFKIAQRRKVERRRDIDTQKDEYRRYKLQELDGDYYQRRQLRLMQVDRIEYLMASEEKEWRYQRTRYLEYEASAVNFSSCISFTLALLAVSAPLWLGLFIRCVWKGAQESFGRLFSIKDVSF
ncbi:hypothetical protein BDV27DRAFT_158657 [Aspergillus caelatus]|uniref:Swt1-like HEPN domain-containing protein n=1 Tax=Aspergillus caelatus TaxID=61420 RepID=A0A5N7A1J8_9EURO|nr:uncharacterized protein BDV27DRAFT_158657 [Aspergillus caelatus]KAE8363565.1 hypothetical protein BDV27DRAFT_158657 [Aspergillus caelatus]